MEVSSKGFIFKGDDKPFNSHGLSKKKKSKNIFCDLITMDSFLYLKTLIP